MEFKIGDKVVYPSHGVGVIDAIETLEFEGVETTFYRLQILDSGMTIHFPIENAVGVRNVMPESMVDDVYEVLRDRSTPPDTQTWNRRYREYMRKISTGDPIEIGKVLRDLAIMKVSKPLSFGEKKMYDQARSLLLQEIAVARGMALDEVERQVNAIFLPDAEAAAALGKPRSRSR